MAVQGEHEVDYLFLSQSLSGQELPLEPNPNEVAEVKYVTPDELRHMMRCVVSKPEWLMAPQWKL